MNKEEINKILEEFEGKFVLSQFAGQKLENPQIMPSAKPNELKSFLKEKLELVERMGYERGFTAGQEFENQELE